jgi:hypothetical protein
VSAILENRQSFYILVYGKHVKGGSIACGVLTPFHNLGNKSRLGFGAKFREVDSR